jgi:hypothetical protein
MKMKHFLILLPLTLASIPVQAQQVNQYGVCTQYQEVYSPGGYDQYGNYYPGGVSTQAYNVPCNQINAGWRPTNQYYNNYGNGSGYVGRATNPNCNPTRTLLGATLGGAIGRSMTSTPNNRNNRGWATALGASLGGLAFAC